MVAFALLYLMTVCWLGFIVAVVLLQGFSRGNPDNQIFKLTDQVMLALLGVSTTTVVGVYLVAANYHFPKKPRWMELAHDRPQARG